METKEPGQATTQYGDYSGETCIDLFEDCGRSTDIHNLLDKWDLAGLKGFIVGFYISAPCKDNERKDKVDFVFQVADVCGVDCVNQQIAENDGILHIKEYSVDDVDIYDFLDLCKRFEFGFFRKGIKAKELVVTKSHSMDKLKEA